MGGDCSTLELVDRLQALTARTRLHRDIFARSQSKVLELVTVRDYPATAASFLIVD